MLGGEVATAKCGSGSMHNGSISDTQNTANMMNLNRNNARMLLLSATDSISSDLNRIRKERR